MIRVPPIAAFAALAAFASVIPSLVGCATAPPVAPPEPVAPAFSTALFNFVPADTPYVFASEGFGTAQFEVAVGTYNEYLTKVPDLLRALTEYMAPDREFTALYEIIADALEFFGEWVTGDHAREVGIAWPMRSAVYGVGLWPTVRIALADPARAGEFLYRQLAAVGVVVEQQVYEGQPYSLVHLGQGFVVLVAVHHGAFVASVTSTEAVDAMLPYLLPTETLPRNIARSGRLTKLVAERAFVPFSVGLVDLAALTRRLLAGRGPESVFGTMLGVSLDPNTVCSQELLDLVATLPTVEFGIRQLDPTAIISELIVPIEDAEIADAVRALVRDGAGLVHEPFANPDLSVSASLDVVGLSNLYTLVTRRLASRDFQCDLLQQLTTQLKSESVQFALLSRLAFGGLRSAHLRVNNLGAFKEGGTPEMLGAVVHDQPLQVLGWLSSIAQYPFPETADGVPVALSQVPAIQMAALGALIAVSVEADDARASVLAAGTGGSVPLFSMAMAGSFDSFQAKMGMETEDALWGRLPPYPPSARIDGPLAVVNGEEIPAARYYDGYNWVESGFPDAQIPMIETTLVESTIAWATREIALDRLGFEPLPDEDIAERFYRYLNRRGAPKITRRKVRAHYRRHLDTFGGEAGEPIPLAEVSDIIKAELYDLAMTKRTDAFAKKHLAGMIAESNHAAIRAQREAAWRKRDALVDEILAIEERIEARVIKSALTVTVTDGALVVRSRVDKHPLPKPPKPGR